MLLPVINVMIEGQLIMIQYTNFMCSASIFCLIPILTQITTPIWSRLKLLLHTKEGPTYYINLKYITREKEGAPRKKKFETQYTESVQINDSRK